MAKTKTDRRRTPVDNEVDPEVLALHQRFEDESQLEDRVPREARQMLP